MHKLTIAVEAKALATLRTGVGQYIFQLYKAMESLENKPDIYYHINRQFTKKIPNSVIVSTSTQRLSYKEKLAKSLDKLGPSLALTKKKLAMTLYKKLYNQQVKKIKPDIIHCTDFFSVENKQGIPEIITVYDLSCFKYPQTHPEARVKFFNEYLPSSLENAQHILTISEFSKREIIEYFSVKPEKITVSYCGLPAGFQPYSKEQTSATLNQFGLEHKKYFLYVGTIEPRKNLEILLDAYCKLPIQIQTQYKLVLVGAFGWKYESFLEKAKKSLNRQRLILPGYMPNHQLQQLMASAHCFLYPSLYEGFGIPPLEAMASGVPVITSDCTSLPEVVGNAGILLSPDDAQQWSEAIMGLIEDQQAYQHAVEKGSSRATLFNWTASAKKTLNCFQQNC
ncbi:MAG TPA: glycosyltransferase family 1 protein [Methyloprofundus sp.]|uniref:glycosyltransferase family 4 protein n=1 Tax=Methyloprofundus sp. TaxID=2020875 RepID=UPI0017D3594A|nr:glycosyltransferase family 1 protein [Methyloprofundus sp.]HIG66145.1 glycosyltransferase family 1 protein [Methyloprofundus sp.]HIL77853.1 glycosyltransferase family 1 protein [Methylococcales bacterium]